MWTMTGTPAIGLSRLRMQTRCHYDVAAIRSNVETWGQVRTVPDRRGITFEEQVTAAATSQLLNRSRERTMLILEVVKTDIAPMPGIYVENPNVRLRPSRQTDVGIWILSPPTLYLVGVIRCIMHAMAAGIP